MNRLNKTWISSTHRGLNILSAFMLACISINKDNAFEAIKRHPEMIEYPHTSNFKEIDEMILNEFYKQ